MMPAALATLYFPAGALIGIVSAAPVGPVNLLVIQRTLASNIGAGLLVGAGGAIGDCVFAVVAAFGLGAAARLLEQHMTAIRVVGGLIMLAFAVAVWRAAPHLDRGGNGGGGPVPGHPARMAAATFTLTMTNPATFLFFIAAFGAVGFVGIGHDTPAHRLNAGLVIAGVFAGSMLWWLAVSGVAHRLRDRITDRLLIVLNRATAILLGAFAAVAVLTGVLSR